MNQTFDTIIQAGNDERRDLFLTAAARMGTAVQNVEKDFWVCWTLDALFNGLPKDGPRLLFKGGTSLSKAFGLISRFSEDIDITVFREDIGEPAEVEDLDALSGKKRRARLDRIRDACQHYIAEEMAVHFREIAETVIPADQFRVEFDTDDPDRQTLLFWYPVVTTDPKDYIRSAVKIEAGAKSTLDPHEVATVKPYVTDDLPDLDLAVRNVTTVKPERTFWDKIIILHGLRQWHDRRGELRHGGQRVSRHYYDIYQLLKHPDAAAWQANHHLAEDCAQHARLFFGSADLGLGAATRGNFTLVRSDGMHDALVRDTLHSLGNFVRVPEMFLARARAAAATIDVPPFGVTLDQISSFRRKERRWPLVLTGSFGMDPLTDFQRKLGDALRAASLRISSARFKPHLTLLYDEGSVEQRAIEPITWTVSEFVLIDSWLGKTHYDVKGRRPLKGRSPSV